MAVYTYKIETIEDYDDDAATEATLNAEGTDGWELVSITYRPDVSTGKSTATAVYMKTS
jgi:hypothetical protein